MQVAIRKGGWASENLVVPLQKIQPMILLLQQKYDETLEHIHSQDCTMLSTPAKTKEWRRQWRNHIKGEAKKIGNTIQYALKAVRKK